MSPALLSLSLLASGQLHVTWSLFKEGSSSQLSPPGHRSSVTPTPPSCRWLPSTRGLLYFRPVCLAFCLAPSREVIPTVGKGEKSHGEVVYVVGFAVSPNGRQIMAKPPFYIFWTIGQPQQATCSILAWNASRVRFVHLMMEKLKVHGSKAP